MRVNDAIIGMVLAVCSLLLLGYARTLPVMPDLGHGPGTFPALVGYGLLAGSLGLIVSGLRARRAPRAEAAPAAADEGADASAAGIGGAAGPGARARGDRLRAVLYALSVPAAVAAYVWLSEDLGFPLVSFAIIASMTAWLTRRWLLAAGVAAVATAVIWYAFAQVLQVPIPRGFF
ncbi:tripartite tricarboxylate transporter TctB family protein [Orrella sp. JC864]|uniref:tripartite tricarboxylate transporter TctB family protein n=1 Tax=Orrella sp. JC864 TaxID=3120298 RepID=UPI0012BC5873